MGVWVRQQSSWGCCSTGVHRGTQRNEHHSIRPQLSGSVRQRFGACADAARARARCGVAAQVTKGGKVETLHALVVVGNHEGLLGVGQHSGKNIQKVTLDAQLKAYRNLVAVPRHRGRTIFHAIDVAERTVRGAACPPRRCRRACMRVHVPACCACARPHVHAAISARAGASGGPCARRGHACTLP